MFLVILVWCVCVFKLGRPSLPISFRHSQICPAFTLQPFKLWSGPNHSRSERTPTTSDFAGSKDDGRFPPTQCQVWTPTQLGCSAISPRFRLSDRRSPPVHPAFHPPGPLLGATARFRGTAVARMEEPEHVSQTFFGPKNESDLGA